AVRAGTCVRWLRVFSDRRPPPDGARYHVPAMAPGPHRPDNGRGRPSRPAPLLMPASNDSPCLGPLLDAVAAENAIRDGGGGAVHDGVVQVAAAARLVLDQALRGPDGPASDEWYERLCALLEHIRRNGVLVWHELRFGHLGQRSLPQVLR